MLLCVDIGNTNIKLGLYKGDELVTHWRIYTDESKLSDEYAVLLLSLFESEKVNKDEIDGCAISSVVPELTIAFRDLVKRHLNLDAVIVGNVKHPVIHINASNPKEVGPDLIANAVGAVALYGAPCIVIGFGTATTFSPYQPRENSKAWPSPRASSLLRHRCLTPAPCSRLLTFTNLKR